MSDRIFAIVVICVAVGFIAAATQIQLSFLTDPVGPKTFPIMVGAVASLAALVLLLRPDPSPSWPNLATLFRLFIAIAVLVAYAYLLKPMGFLLPTFLAAGTISYQIHSRVFTSIVTGLGLAIGLFLIFKYGLGLSLFALPR